MFGEERILEIMKKALSYCQADEAETLFLSHDYSLTRYANSQIHQNTAEQNSTLIIKAVTGKRIGVSTINCFDDSSLKAAAAQAVDAAERQHIVEDFPGLPEKSQYPQIDAFVARTAEVTCEEKALIIRDMIGRAHGERISLSGGFYTGQNEMSYLNTNGAQGYFPHTMAQLSVLAQGKEHSGYADASSRNVDEIDYTSLVEESLWTTREFPQDMNIEPGEYPVILEEKAVGEMLLQMSSMSFSAQYLADGSSFIKNTKGQKIFPEVISIYDSPHSPESFAMPFDYEGSPKTRVDFIKNGVVTGDVVYNNYMAAKIGKKSTGHGVPASSGLSEAAPFQLFIDTGNFSREDLLKKMDEGILVRRFHYLTTVHPLKTIFSGMTRDGIFWVKNGKIRARLKNMRFTQSIVEALQNVKGIAGSRKNIWFREFAEEFPLCTAVPSLYIDKFNFTGVTEF